MANQRYGTRVKAAAANRGTGIEQHLIGASVLALTLAVVLARLAA
jgi:hypothetical protein